MIRSYELIHAVLEEREGALFWKPRGNKRFDTKYAGKKAGGLNSDGYLCVTVKGNNLLQHHVVWLLHTGEWPQELDHKDGNKANNTFENLRIASTQENQFNKGLRRGSNSGYKGVCLCKRSSRWRAHITKDGKTKSLGYFKTRVEAALAYNKAALAHFGEFAKLNEV